MTAITRKEIFSAFVEHIVSGGSYKIKEATATSNTLIYKMVQAQDIHGMCVSASEAYYELAGSVLCWMEYVFHVACDTLQKFNACFPRNFIL